MRNNPFAGDIQPTRVPLFGFGRPTLPFPHIGNYREPIRILRCKPGVSGETARQFERTPHGLAVGGHAR